MSICEPPMAGKPYDERGDICFVFIRLRAGTRQHHKIVVAVGSARMFPNRTEAAGVGLK